MKFRPYESASEAVGEYLWLLECKLRRIIVRIVVSRSSFPSKSAFVFEALPQNCLLNLETADLSALLYAGHEAAIHIEIVATCAKRVANLRVSRRLSPEGGGGGAWAPLAPPPFLDPPLQ